MDSTQEIFGFPAGERTDYLAFHGIRQVFINPVITAFGSTTTTDTEGCLSIPGVQASVPRANSITVQYQESDFVFRQQTFTGRTARMIQHEYDHLEGKLYLDYLNVLHKRLLQGKLSRIRQGKIEAAYPMLYR